jgi:hypothetical protein
MPGGFGGGGRGVPAGGTTGQILHKRTNADYDLEWSSAGVPSFTYQEPFSIAGTEATGTRITIVVPTPSLPPGPFNWVIQGNGYGSTFFTNIGPGTTGTPTGNYTFDIWDGFGWVACATLNAINFVGGDPAVVRGTPSAPGNSRVFRYDPAVLTDITFGLRITSAPTTAFSLVAGIQGYIFA